MKYTCRELVQSVREQVVEANNTRVSTSQILRAINRGYDDALDMLAKQYPDPLISFFEVCPDENGQIDIPEDAFQDRVESVEYYTRGSGDYRSRIRETDDLSAHGVYNDISGGYPSLYSIIGRKIQLAPVNVQKVLIRVWYVKAPLPLVLEQGRIQRVVTEEGGQEYIIIDDLNTEETETPINTTSTYGKYFNIVDSATGKIKCTLQARQLKDGNKRIDIEADPTRTSVFNLEVKNAIPSTIEPDDVISSVNGLGVLFFSRPLANYLIQYAVNEVQRMLGVSNLSFEESKLRDLRKKVQEAWKKRPGAKYKRAHGKIWSNKPWSGW